MKYSRTYQTCQNVLLCLLETYGFKDTYADAEVDAAIEMGAGGDPRTMNRYLSALYKHHFIKTRADGKIEVDLTKLNYRQVKMDESLLALGEEEPP